MTFRPGERTGVQILSVTPGEGIVATRDEKRTVSGTDLVLFPAGEEHWHSTDDDADRSFTHVYFIAEPEDTGPTIFDRP